MRSFKLHKAVLLLFLDAIQIKISYKDHEIFVLIPVLFQKKIVFVFTVAGVGHKKYDMRMLNKICLSVVT